MRCGQCQAAVTPAMRRCGRCGAPQARRDPHAVEILARPAAPWASGDVVAGAYRIVEACGSGPMGTTYRARTRDGRAVAVKVLHAALLPSERERGTFVEQAAALTQKSVRGAAMPLAVVLEHERVLVVSPWVFGASLRTLTAAYRAAGRRLARDQVLGVLRGAHEALRALHAATTHGALYPENVAVTADAVVLLDPGVATLLPSRTWMAQLERAAGVWPYIAPEVRAGKRNNAGADLFSLGALASEMLAGDPSRSAADDFAAADLGTALAGALHAAVSAQPARRVTAVPDLLGKLAQIAGEASLPPYAPLPAPSSVASERVRGVVVPGPGARPPRGRAPRATGDARKAG